MLNFMTNSLCFLQRSIFSKSSLDFNDQRTPHPASAGSGPSHASYGSRSGFGCDKIFRLDTIHQMLNDFDGNSVANVNNENCDSKSGNRISPLIACRYKR